MSPAPPAASRPRGIVSADNHTARALRPHLGEGADVVWSRAASVFVAKTSCEHGERSHCAQRKMSAARAERSLTLDPCSRVLVIHANLFKTAVPCTYDALRWDGGRSGKSDGWRGGKRDRDGEG